MVTFEFTTKLSKHQKLLNGSIEMTYCHIILALIAKRKLSKHLKLLTADSPRLSGQGSWVENHYVDNLRLTQPVIFLMLSK